MPKNDLATVHLKMSPQVRNSVLGKLRSRGTTMQSFFETMMQRIARDDDFLTMLETHTLTATEEPVYQRQHAVSP